jgi:hypothetical protein
MYLCWWCCHPIDGISLQMPNAYNKVSSTYSGVGQFCGFACMKAFNRSSTSDITDQANIIMLIQMMIQDSQKDALLQIQPAPPWQCLVGFGGTMSIEEFRECDKKIDIHLPPIERILYDVEKKSHSSTKVLNASKSSSDYMEKIFGDTPAITINNPLKIKNKTETNKSDSVLCMLNHQP